MVPIFLIRVRNLRIKSSETGNKYYIPPSCVQRYTAILPAIITTLRIFCVIKPQL